MRDDTKTKLKRILSEYESELAYRMMEAEKAQNASELTFCRKKLAEVEEVRRELGIL